MIQEKNYVRIMAEFSAVNWNILIKIVTNSNLIKEFQ